jgi:hypothetical protein
LGWQSPFSRGWPTIHSGPVRLPLIMLERKLTRDWECWVLSWSEEVAPPSETEFCYISSSSGQWWTCFPFGGTVFAPMWGHRCFSPSVFALLPVHLGTLVTGRFRWIWEFNFLLTPPMP